MSVKYVRFEYKGEVLYGVIENEVICIIKGDIILTGTPSGVGPMQPGDRVTVKIEGIGELTNSVISDFDIDSVQPYN